MYIEQLQEDNNIVNINTIEIFKLTKLSIYYLLNIDKQIFESYNSDIELFLALISNKEELMFIFKLN